MIIKKYEKFLESIEDGYSEEFDREFDDANKKIEQILGLSDEWVREELILMTNSELDDLLSSLQRSESATTIKRYVDKKQFSFDSIFGIKDSEILAYLSDVVDQFDYVELDIISDSEDKFAIEIYSTDVKKILKSVFEWYKKNVSNTVKNQLLNMHGLSLFSEKFDEKRNRIILEVKKL